MLEFLFGPPNPTRSWPIACDGEINFDLDQATLNSVRLGEPLGSLSFLGPDEDRRSFRGGELCYYSKGLTIRFNPKTQAIVEYRVVEYDPDEPKYQTFRGTVLSQGRPVALASLSPDELVRQYGDHYWRDRDDYEMMLFFEFAGLEWQVEFDLDSRFKCLTVTNDPIMASEQERKGYGVTEPWPPRTQRAT